MRGSLSSSASPSPLRPKSRVKRKVAILKSAMREKNLDGRREDGKRDPDGISLLCRMEAKGHRISGHNQTVVENERKFPRRGGWAKRIRKIREEEEAFRELLLGVLDRRKQQEEEMLDELEECMASWDTKEETNEHLEHENLANDTKQCDKGGEFGERLHESVIKEKGVGLV